MIKITGTSLQEITVYTNEEKQVIDITDQINQVVKKQKIAEGLCHLFATDTTIALTTVSLDPETILDAASIFEVATPELAVPGSAIGPHRHLTALPGDIIASFIGASLTIPLRNSKLFLGTKQRAVLVELSGPNERKIVIGFG